MRTPRTPSGAQIVVASSAGLRDVVARLVECHPHTGHASGVLDFARGRHLTVGRLTLSAALVDAEAVRRLGRPLTGRAWVASLYGPWSPAVGELLRADASFKLVPCSPRLGCVELSPGAALDGLSARERDVVDAVAATTANLFFGQFVDYVRSTTNS